MSRYCFLKLMLGAWLFAHHEDSKIATHMLAHFTYKVAEKSHVYHDATNMAQFGDVQITNDSRTGQVFIREAAKDATHQSGDVIKGRNQKILGEVAAFIQGYIGHHGELSKCDAECQKFEGAFQASQTNRMMMNSHINQVAIARERVVNMHKAIERKQDELQAVERGLEVSEL